MGSDSSFDRIVLIGFPGSYKTSAGAAAAVELDFAYVDTDREFEKSFGPVAVFVERMGEPLFRIKETVIVKHISGRQRAVISTGGGTPCFGQNMRLLTESSLVIWLDADIKELFNRLGDSGSSARPLLPKSLDQAAALYREREPVYKRHAHVRIDTTGFTPEQAAEKIVSIYRGLVQ
ncbi:MAG: shikimate kinase [Firmicutes bacterium]|nr:shikimate kinase [Bacillota bacterium]